MFYTVTNLFVDKYLKNYRGIKRSFDQRIQSTITLRGNDNSKIDLLRFETSLPGGFSDSSCPHVIAYIFP